MGDHDGADDVDVDVDVEFLFVFLFFLSPSFVTKFNDEVVAVVDTHTETKRIGNRQSRDKKKEGKKLLTRLPNVDNLYPE